MADTFIISEFLVSLGFLVKHEDEKKAKDSVASLKKAVLELGEVITAVGALIEAGVTRMAISMEDLYFASQRIGSSVENIKAVEFAVSNVGGSAEGARSSLEGLARFMRNSPGGETWLNGLGVQTRDAHGHMKDLSRVNLDFIEQISRTKPQYQWSQYAQTAGIDEKTFYQVATHINEAEAAYARYQKTAKESGQDMQANAKAAHEFMMTLRDLGAQVQIVAQMFMARFAPGAKLVLKLVEGLVRALEWLDRETGGVSTVLIGLGIAFGAVLLVLSPFLAALLAVGAAVGAAITAPVWLAVAAVTALALAGGFLVAHWKEVIAFFQGAPAWVKHQLGIGDAPSPAPRPGNAPPSSPPAPRPGNAPAEPANQGAASGNAVSQALDFFKRNGWRPDQAAGIVSNLFAESGLKIGAVGDSGRAFGIAQWHEDRQAEFKKMFGHDIRQSTLMEQLSFVQAELTTGARKHAGDLLRAAVGSEASAATVSRYYESPSDANGEAQRRAALASQIASGHYAARPSRTTHVHIDQKTEIKVAAGPDAAATAKRAAQAQGRVNGDMLRNMQGAVA